MFFFYGEKTVFTPFEGKFFIGTTDIGKLILLFIIVVVLVAALKVVFNDSGRTFS